MKLFCVISHTHWDREWYQPFEVFRLRLVDLIDRCLELLETSPDYIFHLDAQTIVLEDYLEIRESKRQQLEKFVQQGRLIVGPWYLQNDFYLTSGESTIRNLLFGHRIAEKFGACQKVGYAADQFGNISQLPQILSDFDIKNFVFGRGYTQYKKEDDGQYYRKTLPSEFIWKGADGTEVLAINMPYWYNNAQRFPSDIDKSIGMLNRIEGLFENVATTPYLLLMNGVDHLEAQDDLLPIINKVNSRLGDEKQVLQYKLDDYIRHVKSYIKENDIKLKVCEGELHDGGDFDLLKGTLSSRVYLKNSNVKAQNRLECHLEPLYSMLELSGMQGVYSLDYFNFMWKELLKNHAHDSICGCSVDNVHTHMEDNYLRLKEVYGELLNRGLEIAAEHIDIPQYDNDNYVIVAANTTEFKQSTLVRVSLDILKKDDYKGFVITDGLGNRADYAIISRRDAARDVYSPLNLPGKLDVDRYDIYLYVKDINPFSFKGYVVSKDDISQDDMIDNKPIGKLDSEFQIGNENLIVKIHKNGQVDLCDIEKDKWYIDIIDIEETADRGDAYVYFATQDDVIKGSDFDASVSVLEDNEMVSRIEIIRDMLVPDHYDFENKKRSEIETLCRVTLELCLEKGAKTLSVNYKIDNTAKDHRMRLVIRTGVDTDSIITDIPFDILQHKDNAHFEVTMSKVVANTSFALLENDRNGMAVFTEGMHEAEHLPDEKAIALTMVRCTGVVSRHADLSEGGGENWRAPENQCIRTVTGRAGILPYTGGYINTGVYKYSKLFRNKPLAYFTSCDSRKFKVGRATVQETDLQDYYYIQDPYAKVKIKDNSSLVEVLGTGVSVSALKKSEGGDGIILRVVNLDENTQDLNVKAKGVIYKTTMHEKRRDYICSNSFKCNLPSKKIATYCIDKNYGESE
ncbi:MAG: glycoside hydrolase family 38 C-terminal domain-containing protein [Oscillospiraceae bacterium]|nr:glycoside hydrolase family 38 C-terminal domain-containing protein [Oscillospiraceae bacterium]MDD4413518.1 glycoside hydrolase family 38 C-terminal domain-containing protein [Oscillospiraceae bacterium]